MSQKRGFAGVNVFLNAEKKKFYSLFQYFRSVSDPTAYSILITAPTFHVPTQASKYPKYENQPAPSGTEEPKTASPTDLQEPSRLSLPST